MKDQNTLDTFTGLMLEGSRSRLPDSSNNIIDLGKNKVNLLIDHGFLNFKKIGKDFFKSFHNSSIPNKYDSFYDTIYRQLQHGHINLVDVKTCFFMPHPQTRFTKIIETEAGQEFLWKLFLLFCDKSTIRKGIHEYFGKTRPEEYSKIALRDDKLIAKMKRAQFASRWDVPFAEEIYRKK